MVFTNGVVLMREVHDAVRVGLGVAGGQVCEVVEAEQGAKVRSVCDQHVLEVGLSAEQNLLKVVLQNAVVCENVILLLLIKVSLNIQVRILLTRAPQVGWHWQAAPQCWVVVGDPTFKCFTKSGV
jgi:hypothetical protein